MNDVELGGKDLFWGITVCTFVEIKTPMANETITFRPPEDVKKFLDKKLKDEKRPSFSNTVNAALLELIELKKKP